MERCTGRNSRIFFVTFITNVRISNKTKNIMEAVLDYWDCLRRTKQYASGGYYQDPSSEITRQETIKGETEIEIFEQFYKLNNSLRYCNGSYYKWQLKEWEDKYQAWLKSDDYEAKSFNLYYGNGVVD